MNFSLGSFIHRRVVEAEGNSLDSLLAYYRGMWELVINGLEIIRPKRCGNTEPLKKVGDVDLSNILSDDFIFSNGRKCLGIVHRPAFRDREYYSISLAIELKKGQSNIAEELYFWLRENTRFSCVYKATRTNWLLENHLAFHQTINTGVTELDLAMAIEMQELFDHFEIVPNNTLKSNPTTAGTPQSGAG